MDKRKIAEIIIEEVLTKSTMDGLCENCANNRDPYPYLDATYKNPKSGKTDYQEVKELIISYLK